jgi:hypothetical protein
MIMKKKNQLIKVVTLCMALVAVLTVGFAVNAKQKAKADGLFDWFERTSVKKCAISLEKNSFSWTGEQITPEVRVNYKGTDLVKNVDYVLTYALTHLFAGGLMFGAVFMVTDPVTAPTSPLGKVIFGIGAAMLTMLIRVFGNLPEGVVFSIVIMNLVTPLIDSAIKGKTTTKVWKSWLTVGIALAIAVLVNVGFAFL